MEQQKSITPGVCRKCDRPRYKGALCHKHYRERANEKQNRRRERLRTKTCKCGRAIFEDSTTCRHCNLAKEKGNAIELSPAPRVFAGRWEEWAAMKEDVCPKRARFVERVERGRA